jgi:hypothetical protein
MGKRHLLLLPVVLALVLSGCAARFTNLTASRLPRSETGLYPLEVAMTSQERAVNWSSIQAVVRIGEESYPMERVPMMTNRWEAQVPVPAGTNVLYFRYQFRFVKYAIGKPVPDSAMSQTYSLRILDK